MRRHRIRVAGVALGDHLAISPQCLQPYRVLSGLLNRRSPRPEAIRAATSGIEIHRVLKLKTKTATIARSDGRLSRHDPDAGGGMRVSVLDNS